MNKGSRNFSLESHAFPVVLTGGFLAAALAAAAGLRLFRLDQQIPAGDEWNSIRYATCNTLSWILTHFNKADNCVPLTVYIRILLKTTGLDEWTLRLPQLTAGLSMILLFPLLIRSLYSRRTRVLFAFLLALSPFLVFYSRFARPYVLVALFSFTAILCFFHWWKTGRRVFAALYIAAAVLGPFFHLTCLPFVAAPLLFALSAAAAKRLLPLSIKPPKVKSLLLPGGLVVLGNLLHLLPRLPTLHVLTDKVHQGEIGRLTLVWSLHLFTGTAVNGVSFAVALLMLYGVVASFHRRRALTTLLVFASMCQISCVLLLAPAMGQYPMVFARYLISLLPMCLLFLSLAVDDLCAAMERVMVKAGTGRALPVFLPVMGGLLLVLFLVGPLPRLYRRTNNFTHHHDYQCDYAFRVIRIVKALSPRFPGFYETLRKDGEVKAVIEAPFIAKWSLLNYHLYQQYHGKRVYVGHPMDSLLTQARRIMDARIRFSTFVNLEKPEEVKRSGAEFLVLHKDLEGELFHVRNGCAAYERFLENVLEDKDHAMKRSFLPSRKEVERLMRIYRKRNVPVYEDRWITVFALK